MTRHYRWSPSSRQPTGASTILNSYLGESVEHLDDVRIYTCSGGAPSKRVVVNELDLGTPDWVEFYNPEDHAVSMTASRLLAYRADSALATTYVFLTFTLASGAHVVLREGSGTNTATDRYTSSSDMPWANASNGAARL